MISAIVNGLFNLITQLAALITTPLVNAIASLIPGFSMMLLSIRLFFNRFLSYIPIILDLALIPRDAVVALFDFYVVLYTIYLVQVASKFVIKVYNYFKF